MLIIADKIQVRIGGARLEGYYMTDFRLKQENNKPNEFSFKMMKNEMFEDDRDITFEISSKLLGQKLEFALTTIREDEGNNPVNETLEFEGIILGANSIRSDMGACQEIKVTACSYDYLLMDSPHCTSFENENLQSIVASVMGGYKGIKLVNQPATTSGIAYSVQYNETTYDYIKRLANRFGEWFYSDGIEVVFGKVKKGKPVTLLSGTDILGYDYQLQMKHMKFAHASHNYLDDDENRAEGSIFSGGAVTHMMTDTVYSSSESAFSKQTYHDLLGSNAEDNPLDEPAAAARAQALGRKAMMTVCTGRTNRADLKPGSVIIIREAYGNAPDDLRYCTHDPLLICGIEHRATGEGFYENTFTAIPATATCPPWDDVDLYPHATAQRAVVKDNKDPARLGRVKVQFHWQKQQDESLTTPWIRISQPHGGGNKGFYFIPETGEEVMVGFENGNAEKPYVTGTLYHGQAKPDSEWYNDENHIKAIRTRSGHTIELNDDENGRWGITISDKDGNVVHLDTRGKNIEITAPSTISLNATDITLNASQNITANAGVNAGIHAGKLANMTAGTTASVDAGANVFVGAVANVSVDAGKSIAISGKKSVNMSSCDGAAILLDAKGNSKLMAKKLMDMISNGKMSLESTKKSTIKSKDLNMQGKNKAQVIGNKVQVK